MPYVRRNQRGEIIALHATRQTGLEEELPADHPEILDFLGDGQEGAQTPALTAASDRQLTGALEDLIALLAERKVIDPDDLPPGQQEWPGDHPADDPGHPRPKTTKPTGE